MILHLKRPKSFLKLIVGAMVIFGAVGFNVSVINAAYGNGIDVGFFWLAAGCMITGMLMIGFLRKRQHRQNDIRIS